jgi:hypothetical protein
METAPPQLLDGQPEPVGPRPLDDLACLGVRVGKVSHRHAAGQHEFGTREQPLSGEPSRH